MTNNYVLSFSESWAERYSGNLAKPSDPYPLAKQPISNLILPNVFTGRLISITASSSTAKPNWSSAGWVWVNVKSGAYGDGQEFTAQATNKTPFYLNQETIISVPDLATEYKIELAFRYWLEDISIQVSEYVGGILNSTNEKLDLILQTLLNLEDELSNVDDTLLQPLNETQQIISMLLGGFL